MEYSLPDSELWYNYYTKQREDHPKQTVILNDLEQAVFIRGGSVLPILEHEGCLALLQCFQNQVRFEVYLDDNREAQGELYLDDGETYEYLNDTDGHARVQITYRDNTLTSENIAGTDYLYGPN